MMYDEKSIMNCAFNVLRAGFQKVPKKRYYKELELRTLNCYAVLMVSTGSGVFYSDATGECSVSAGDAILLFPGVDHKYGPLDGGDWDEYWIMFDGFLLEEYRRKQLIAPSKPIFHVNPDTALIEEWESFLARYSNADSDIHLSGFSIVWKLLKCMPSSTNRGTSHEKLIHELVQMVESRINEQYLNFPELCENYSFSYSYLRRLFRNHTGYAPDQYFNKVKIDKAKDLLLRTSQPIRDIALDLGFPDPYYFSRLFRQYVKLSPKQYRLAFVEYQ